jgi:hypothetical protein
MLTIGIKKLKSCVEMFKLPCVTVSALCVGKIRTGSKQRKYPDHGQKWPKHVCRCKILLKNIYYLCISLGFLNNYTIIHGVEHTKLK